MLTALLLAVLCFGTTNSAFTKPPPTDGEQTCFEKQADFDAMCKERYGGITDGARCFFYGDNAQTYEKAWDVCAQYEAELAQLHTSLEYYKVVNYTVGTFGVTADLSKGILMPFRVTANTPYAQTCQMDPNATFWYSAADTPNPAMPMNITWLGRNHSCDALGAGGRNAIPGRCLLIRIQGRDRIWVADDDCVNPFYYPICVIKSCAQSFVTTGVCLNETAISNSTVKKPIECAEACSSVQWCRSFNFIKGGRSGNSCQLFSWSIADTNRTRTDASCTHYNYVPQENYQQLLAMAQGMSTTPTMPSIG